MKRIFAFITAIVITVVSFTVPAVSDAGTRDAVGMSLAGLNTVDLYGTHVDDSIFAGHTMTVMNFWATWCGPCIGEMPDFLTLYNYYEATPQNDVQLWGVLMYDFPDEIPEAIQMTEENGWTWGHMRKNAQLYGIAQALVGDGSVPIPQTIIVDRTGTVRAHKRARFFDYEEMYEYVSGWYETLAAEEAANHVLGDVDGSGAVNANDALLVLRYSLGIIGESALDLSAADASCDGTVNANDALLILRRALGLIDSF